VASSHSLSHSRTQSFVSLAPSAARVGTFIDNLKALLFAVLAVVSPREFRACRAKFALPAVVPSGMDEEELESQRLAQAAAK